MRTEKAVSTKKEMSLGKIHERMAELAKDGEVWLDGDSGTVRQERSLEIVEVI